MAQINLYPENTSELVNLHRWQYCYLHGNAEFEYDPELSPAPDIFLADAPMPDKAGNYIVYINDEPAIAVIALHHGILSGRVSLVSDPEALRHALDEKNWQ